VKKLSATQNHGKPRIGHTCYAEADKAVYCATVVWYTGPNGNLAFARIMRRGDNDQLVERDVCDFNDEQNIRTCINFDDGHESKWFKDAANDWVQIGQPQSDDEAAGGGLSAAKPAQPIPARTPVKKPPLS
jgi:hypothetical protein